MLAFPRTQGPLLTDFKHNMMTITVLTLHELTAMQVCGNTSQLRWTHSNDRGKLLAVGDRIFTLDGEIDINTHRAHPNATCSISSSSGGSWCVLELH